VVTSQDGCTYKQLPGALLCCEWDREISVYGNGILEGSLLSLDVPQTSQLIPTQISFATSPKSCSITVLHGTWFLRKILRYRLYSLLTTNCKR